MLNSRCLVCKRDPDCKKHPYHAGHISYLNPLDPRDAYRMRQEKKEAGHRAWLLVSMMEKDSPFIALTPLQRRMLVLYIQDEILLRALNISKEAPKAWKDAEFRAWDVVRMAEKYLDIASTSSQRDKLVGYIRDEILKNL